MDGGELIETETGEAAALASIVTWSAESPEWQRDALRRLCISDELSETDIDELLAIAKGAATGIRITVDDVRDPGAAATVINLQAIRNVRFVGALAKDEKLTFDKSGMTVIYGDNGAGKSGYARILKRVCRARVPKVNEPIHSNIYESTTGTATADIDFLIGTRNETATWTDGRPADARLSAVSFFDSKTASVHVNQSNEIAYTPLPLRLLEDLAEACKKLKVKLAAEVKTLEDQTPEVIRRPRSHDGTAVTSLLRALSAQTAREDVEALATLSETEKSRLETLRADLAADPKTLARQLRAAKRSIDDFVEKLKALEYGVSDSTVSELRRLLRAYEAAREAAATASTTLFAAEPLPNVGSDTWKVLWEAARAYSTVDAYPGREFPVIDGGRCVLCHQELDQAASARLKRFEKFITDDCMAREATAKEEWEAEHERFIDARISQSELMAFVTLLRDAVGNPILATLVRKAVTAALWRHKFFSHHFGDEQMPVAAVGIPIAELAAQSDRLEARAVVFSTEAGSEERKVLEAERDALLDREWLSTIKEDVLAEIDRRIQIAALDEVTAKTVTNRITIKATELASKLVTNALRAQFIKEVASLGAANLAVELKQEKSTSGVPKFKVILTRKPTANVADILSEGEHRCVALAAFLAELSTADVKSAIVFDDPISSLDHNHREEVAGRLAREALHRQVIVFTHDVAFVLLLSEACREIEPTSPSFVIRSVMRNDDHAGICSPQPPFKARPLLDVITTMENWLASEKCHYEKGDMPAWERTVGGLQRLLRMSWERAVEEALSPVLRRLSNKVHTDGLAKVTVITLEHCEAMRDGYGRCSALLHTDSPDMNKALPKPAVVAAEIKALRDWVEDVKSLQRAVG